MTSSNGAAVHAAAIIGAAAAIGAVAGMRAMTAPAFVSRIARAGGASGDGKLLRILEKPATAKTTMLLAAGEYIFDKLPSSPKRTAPSGLLARIVSGALCGAALCSLKNKPPLTGALAGVLGAVGVTYAAYRLRKRAGEVTHVPDAALGIAEDLLALSAGTAVSRMMA